MKHSLLRKTSIAGLLFYLLTGSVWAQDYRLTSPDGKLNINICTEKALTWSIEQQGDTVILPSAIALKIREDRPNGTETTWGNPVKVSKASEKEIRTSFSTPFYKRTVVKDQYNQLLLKCKGGYSIEFRAYDDGAAYRFILEQRKPMLIEQETAEFNFTADHQAFIPYVNDNRGGERYCYPFESYYDECKLSEMIPDSLAITPLMVDLGNGHKAVIMDAGVENYPGMFLLRNNDKPHALTATFAPYPLEETVGGHNRLNFVPTRRADYLAHTDARQTLPWRVVIVSEKDTQLADNDMAQRLAPACRLTDTSWIIPGKVAWDWWNACNLTGVDFKAGINTPTYKAYIDFAAENHLEYIIIDEGWSSPENLLDVNPEIDLEALIAYGNQKNVGIILWSSWRNAIKDTDNTFKHYSKLGIKGFKIDFFDRDDQPVIRSMYELAQKAADNHLVLDYHGIKPGGIQRAYPNILNFEGVKGLENAKWEPIVNGQPLHDFPRYDVSAPFLRMLAGPMDYTPGAMINATRSAFRAVYDRPMSQGTRVHQMAMYTLFESPLQMLADSPNKYRKEQECTDFIAKVPTVFDETVALDGKVGEYISLARCKDGIWYVGAMTDWTPRQCTIDLSFLSEGEYEAEIFADGINADREATDYRKEIRTVKTNDKLNIEMAPGGGWTARITPKK
ncbi:glycoside hydrolase family 97 protein [Phocaeicola barnesiae]